MSQCLKTGCHVYLPEYGMWARGDAFEMIVTIDDKFESVYFFRFTSTSFEPMEKVKHFTIKAIEHDFDRNNEVQGEVAAEDRARYVQTHWPAWTVIAKQALFHGNEGINIYRED